MTDASLNPLLKKNYYIWESKPYPPKIGQIVQTLTDLKFNYGGSNSTNCSTYYSTMAASKITNLNSNPDTTKYSSSSKNVSLLDAQTYIVKAINDLTTDIALAQSCDTSSRYSGPSSGGCCTGSMIQPICSKTFSNFADADYKPGVTKNDNGTLKNPLLQMQDYLYVENNKKSFCQQVNDISGLIQDFKNIYTNLSNGVLSNFKINKTDPNTSYQNMLTLRNKLDMKLQSLLNKTDLNGPQYQSKLQLDSTVYTTVLWTVLATSVLYYVFIKI